MLGSSSKPSVSAVAVLTGCLLLVAATACSPDGGGSDSIAESSLCYPESRALRPLEARNFSVEETGRGLSLVVRSPDGSSADESYLLTSCQGSRSASADEFTLELPSPPQRVATASTTVLSHLEALGLLDRLSGHQGLRNVTSPAVLQRAAEGQVVEIGDGARTNREKLLALAPDLYLGYRSGGLDEAARGMPTLHMTDFLEPSPLARAEWIVLTGYLFGREQRAIELFEDVRERYLELVELAAQAEDRPKILFAAPFAGVWHVPRGDSFAARLIADAGGDYLWSDIEGAGSVALDIEAVWERAHQADLWLQPFGWTSLQAGIEADPRFADLPALQGGDVFNNDRLTTPEGGNDYWERGAWRPDLVLADLVHILHPELLPGHELVFHRRLPER